MEKTLLLVTTGSHLYGLASLESDLDLYEIYDFTHKNYRPRRQSRHKIEENRDKVRVSFDKFREFAIKGVPQALEVLFSQEPYWISWDYEWPTSCEEVVGEVRLHLDGVMDTYRRTVVNFFREDNFKKNRHGFRLMLNARDLKEKGRFDPTLTEEQKGLVNELALLYWEERVERFKDMLWETFG